MADSVTKRRAVTVRWHVGAVGCGVATLAFALWLAPPGAWAWWALLLPVGAGGLFLWLAQQEAQRTWLDWREEANALRSRTQVVEEQLEAEGKCRNHLENLHCQESTLWAGERQRLESALASAQQATETLAAEHEHLRSELRRLLADNQALQAQQAETLERRRVLEGQYLELEASARQLGAAHSARAERHRVALDELGQLRTGFQQLNRDLEAAQAEKARLRSELDLSVAERRNLELRAARLEASITEWQERAEAIQAAARRQEVNRALEEELAARRREIQQLCAELETQRAQRELAEQQAQAATTTQHETETEFKQLKDAVRQREQVIDDLQAECRRQHEEPRQDLMSHFVWQVNYFGEKEVLLTFQNAGASLDFIELVTEPTLMCELPPQRTVPRGSAGRLRISSPTALPQEFLLRCRYTIYPQEAAFRLRPAGPVKLERL